jgi:hypothetical protein
VLTQIGLVLIVAGGLVAWARSGRGRAARALVGRAKTILLVPPVLWASVWLLNTTGLGPLDTAFFTIPGTLALSVTLLLVIALHVAASVLVLATLGRAAGWGSVSARQILPGILLGQSALWLSMLALIRPFTHGTWSPGMIPLLAALGIPLVALNLLLARLVARLPANGGRVRDSFAGLWRADRAREAPLLATVMLRLVVTGAIVLIWISGYTTVRQSGTRTTRTTRSATSVNIDVQTVATVTCDNPWLREVADAAAEEPPEALRHALDLATAFVSVLFMAAFVSARAPETAAPPAPRPG